MHTGTRQSSMRQRARGFLVWGFCTPIRISGSVTVLHIQCIYAHIDTTSSLLSLLRAYRSVSSQSRERVDTKQQLQLIASC